MKEENFFTKTYLHETLEILSKIDIAIIDELALTLAEIRNQKGRLFILGVGGSAGNAGHAVNDFRKICGFDAFTPTDNVSELTARINDEGWDNCYANWLKGSHLNSKDCLLIFSVGGGDADKKISTNLIQSIKLAQSLGAKITGIVGKNGGATKAAADVCLVIPPLFAPRITPHTEGITAIIWHLLVSHPQLKIHQTKWESSINSTNKKNSC